MSNRRGIILGLLLLALGGLACGALTPAGGTPPVQATLTAPPNGGPTLAPSAAANASPTSAAATQPPATATLAATAVPTVSPEPTAAPLALEIVQTQVWLDEPIGNARANVLFRNPYDFPVELTARHAALYNSGGDLIRQGNLYFLDGISAGGGYLLPGETIAANVCFTCEEQLLSEPWESLRVITAIRDATGQWETVTTVAPTLASVEFDSSAIFWVTGTVQNNSDAPVQRISVRVIVYDPDGQLLGAAEASAWDVPAGATGDFSGYGLGQAPAGEYTTEVTALGVNY